MNLKANVTSSALGHQQPPQQEQKKTYDGKRKRERFNEQLDDLMSHKSGMTTTS
mgnify:CR=1 FL=1